VVALLRHDFDEGRGLASATSLYEAARIVGEQVRRVAEIDRAALERDGVAFNLHLLLGGQIRGGPPGLYMLYPQGNPMCATEDSPYLQIGESKYGRPILDRGIRYDGTGLDEAVKYALISLDSTMRSNVTVGPPIDLAVYRKDELRLTRYHRPGPKIPTFKQFARIGSNRCVARSRSFPESRSTESGADDRPLVLCGPPRLRCAAISS
jgi:putative proteasome-type protease